MPAIESWTVGLLALTAFAAGLVDAIAGGGGLITVPALLAAGLPPQVALASNKGQACFGAVSSCVSFWRHNGIDRPRAPLGFVAGFIGSLAGARVLLMVRPEPLKPVVLILLLIAAGIVMVPRRSRPGWPAHGQDTLLVRSASRLASTMASSDRGRARS